jgi:hypothetical protein
VLIESCCIFLKSHHGGLGSHDSLALAFSSSPKKLHSKYLFSPPTFSIYTSALNFEHLWAGLKGGCPGVCG